MEDRDFENVAIATLLFLAGAFFVACWLLAKGWGWV